MRVVDLSFPIGPHFRWTVASERRSTSIFSPETRIAREECTTHHVFFPAGVTVIEYLTNLEQIGAPRCRFIALPLRVTGADGSPVRAIALVD